MSLSPPAALVVIGACALAVLGLGTLLARIVDQLADRTGWGEAISGAVLLGAATSLSGVVVSVTAASQGRAELALSNAVGGIAAQTFFLAIADVFHRRANLEHAAASLPNIMQAGLLIVLLALMALAPSLPSWAPGGVHPVTLLLVGTYVYGLRLVEGARDQPMWQPRFTRETRTDVPEAQEQLPRLRTLWMTFLPVATLLGCAGWVLEMAATDVIEGTAATETTIGLFLTAITTSLPELVTSVAAVRRGALTLAVGGIIGGNAFDTLLAAASDLFYRPGSVYHAASDAFGTWLLLSILMVAVLVMGLLRRQRRGVAGIGFESLAIVVIYAAGCWLVT